MSSRYAWANLRTGTNDLMQRRTLTSRTSVRNFRTHLEKLIPTALADILSLRALRNSAIVPPSKYRSQRLCQEEAKIAGFVHSLTVNVEPTA